MTKFNPGDRVVRIKGHTTYYKHEGEFATVVSDSRDEQPRGVVKILFDDRDIFSGNVFNSYRCNIRLIEKADSFDVDE